MTIAIRIIPNPSASGRSPLLVSSAMAVVITRVTPSMFPPTIITAPTSAAARPNPARIVVSNENRVSQSSVSAAPKPPAPRERSAERQAQQCGDRHRRQAHAQAEQNDLDKLGVEPYQQRERSAQGFRHARLMATVLQSVLIDVYEVYPRTQPHEYGASNHAY